MWLHHLLLLDSFAGFSMLFGIASLTLVYFCDSVYQQRLPLRALSIYFLHIRRNHAILLENKFWHVRKPLHWLTYNIHAKQWFRDPVSNMSVKFIDVCRGFPMPNLRQTINNWRVVGVLYRRYVRWITQCYLNHSSPWGFLNVFKHWDRSGDCMTFYG